MRSGYRILWTDHALDELDATVDYLQLKFSRAEISRLATAIESTISNIASNPLMYPESGKASGVRRAVILRFNSLYYRLNSDSESIEIISFFSNRRDPELKEF